MSLDVPPDAPLPKMPENSSSAKRISTTLDKPLCKMVEQGLDCVFVDDEDHLSDYLHPALPAAQKSMADIMQQLDDSSDDDGISPPDEAPPEAPPEDPPSPPPSTPRSPPRSPASFSSATSNSSNHVASANDDFFLNPPLQSVRTHSLSRFGGSNASELGSPTFFVEPLSKADKLSDTPRHYLYENSLQKSLEGILYSSQAEAKSDAGDAGAEAPSAAGKVGFAGKLSLLKAALDEFCTKEQASIDQRERAAHRRDGKLRIVQLEVAPEWIPRITVGSKPESSDAEIEGMPDEEDKEKLEDKKKKSKLSKMAGKLGKKIGGGKKNKVERLFDRMKARNNKPRPLNLEETAVLHLHVVEGVQLPDAEGRPSGKLNSFVQAYVMPKDAELEESKAMNSTMIYNCLNPVFDEYCHLTFTSADDMLVFDLYDAHKAKSDTLVARAIVPLEEVKKYPKYCGEMVGLQGWIPFFSPKDMNQPAQGCLNIRIAFDVGPSKEFNSRYDAFKSVAPWPLPEEKDSFSLFVGTWNLGNAPPSNDLSDWIPVGDHDIYMIGCQECKYDDHSGYHECREHYRSCLVRHFGKDYTLVGYKGLWAIRNIVFVRNSLAHRINGVTHAKEATGIGNVMGNKGGVVAAMYFDHTSLGFVSAHLAAHQGMVTNRNLNVRNIIKHSVVGQARSQCPTYPDLFNQFNHLFFCGDLNYRLAYGTQGDDKSPSAEQFSVMVAKIKEPSGSGIQELLQYDQLRNEMRFGRAFWTFQEGDIRFRPTFKVRRNKVLTYNPQRSPAFCDRVVHKSMPGIKGPKQITYSSAEHILSSDHKPVSATYVVPLLTFASALDPSRSACKIKFTNLDVTGVIGVTQRKKENSAKKGGISAQMSKLKFNVKSAMQGGAQAAQDFNCFLHFSSPLLVNSFGTEKLSAQYASWSQTTPPVNPLQCNNVERLRQSQIFIEVLDSKSSAVAHGVLALGGLGCWDEISKPGSDLKSVGSKFALQLNYAGAKAGNLQGQVNFHWTSSGWSK